MLENPEYIDIPALSNRAVITINCSDFTILPDNQQETHFAVGILRDYALNSDFMSEKI